MNTIDLDHEWGAIDLLEEVETSFGIKIGDAVVERITTVGELYDAIRNLTPAWDMRLPHRWAMLTGLAAEHGFGHRPRFSRHIFTLEKFEACQQVSVNIGTFGVESIELFGVIMSLRALLVPPFAKCSLGRS